MEDNDINNDEFDIPVDIDREVNILSDGRQYMIKIPKEVSDFLEIKKGYKFRFLIEIPEDKTKKPTQTFEIIKNGN